MTASRKIEDQGAEPGHTPGPWSIDPMYPDDIIGGDGRDVAETHLSAGYVRDADVRRANAAFIVKACNAHDDLLASLKAVITGSPNDDDDTLNRTINEALAAIARAEGRT